VKYLALYNAFIFIHVIKQSFYFSCNTQIKDPRCTTQCCGCGVLVNRLGTHGLVCRISSGHHLRHSLINDAIIEALQISNNNSNINNNTYNLFTAPSFKLGK
jgi:hypothetical protein